MKAVDAISKSKFKFVLLRKKIKSDSLKASSHLLTDSNQINKTF